MAQSPKYKIYRRKKYIGCVKDATDAAVLVSVQADGEESRSNSSQILDMKQDARKSYGRTVDCKCGRKVADTVGAKSRHRKSVYHRQYRRIEALLSKPCVNFAEIGRRVGVSREYVRQIYTNILGRGTGREREVVCAVNFNKTASKNATKFISPDAVEFWAKAVKAGYECALVPCVSPSTYRESYNRRVLTVNGQTVLIRKTITHLQDKYLTIFGPKTDAAFAAYHMPDKRWLILPRDKWPRNTTQFAAELSEYAITRSLRRPFAINYRDYIENWDLLKSQNQTARARGSSAK